MHLTSLPYGYHHQNVYLLPHRTINSKLFLFINKKPNYHSFMYLISNQKKKNLDKYQSTPKKKSKIILCDYNNDTNLPIIINNPEKSCVLLGTL